MGLGQDFMPNPPVQVVGEADRMTYAWNLTQRWALWHTIDLGADLIRLDETDPWSNFPTELTFFNVASRGRTDWRTNMEQASRVPYPMRIFQIGCYIQFPRFVRLDPAVQGLVPEFYSQLGNLFSFYNRAQLVYEQSDIMDVPAAFAPGGVGINTPVATAVVTASPEYESMLQNLTNGVPVLVNSRDFGNEGYVLGAGQTMFLEMHFDAPRIQALQQLGDTFPMKEFLVGWRIEGYRGKRLQ